MAILKGTPVQRLIVDVSLPTATDGFQLAEKLRDDPRHCRTPVVFLTSPPTPSPPRYAAARSSGPRRT
jgi:CheY-like chemotaxis protein